MLSPQTFNVHSCIAAHVTGILLTSHLTPSILAKSLEL